MGLNSFMNIHFFFLLMMGFHMNFLMGIFANLRFSNTNSGFGTANLIISIVTLLFFGGVLALSVFKQRRIEQVISELKINPQIAEDIKQHKQVLLNRYLKNIHETKNWCFLKHGISADVSGLSCYIYQLSMAKEILTVCCVLIFIDQPLA